jgi:photosystem II stability/assembly factor-like uncharacterized protein
MLSLMRALTLLALCALPLAAHAQWDILDTHTTADLRGVSAPTPGIVWISGTNGTVLRSEDAGYLWQHCTTPPNAEQLDFRGIQAFDANTAIVMSSGKGDLSRLYKTTDGCQTWKLVFSNPDKDGFWDAIQFVNDKLGFILGDPVTYRNPKIYRTRESTGFAMFATEDGGLHFDRRRYAADEIDPKLQGAFAASNTSMFIGWPFIYFGSGGTAGPRIYLNAFQQHISYLDQRIAIDEGDWHSVSWPTPLAKGQTSGIFSLAFIRAQKIQLENEDGTAALPTLIGVAVGGDYLKPNDPNGTAAFTTDGGQHWFPATTPPHGYRSSIAYDAPTHTWITVGPNGTDISKDDGRNWGPLHPTPGQPSDADQHWNALALPFVVGPHGRVGMLNPAALQPTPTKP